MSCWYPAAQCAMQDTESAIPVTPLTQLPSTGALVTENIVQGDGRHVKTANAPSEQAAVELLAVHPAAQLTVYTLSQPYSSHLRRKCRPHSWRQKASCMAMDRRRGMSTLQPNMPWEGCWPRILRRN